MINLAEHITTLLSKEELVILPYLGGFLLHNHGADIYHSQHSIQPPGAHVVFNAALSNNDGVLAHHIAAKENISYKKALQALEVFAQLCKDEMQKGHSILFEQMGLLSYNANQKLHFEPLMTENHSAVHFALPSISLMPIVRQEPTIVKLQKQVPADIRQQKHIIRRVAAVAIPLLTLGLVAYQWLPLRNTHKVNMSLLPTRHAAATSMVVEDVSNKTVYHIDYFCDDESVSMLSQESMEVLSEKANSSQGINVLPQGRFHIISGVFNTEERANRWMDELTEKGFKPYLLPRYQNGRYWVSAANYSNKSEALEQLRLWQAEDAPDWWFYEKPMR